MVLVVCHVLSLVLIAGIGASAFEHLVLQRNRNSSDTIIVNPFESDADYVNSRTFRRTFLSDAEMLIRYLAVCKQFETDGEFDVDKEIDLLQYYYRKNPNVNISSNGLLTYRVQDLIAWSDSYGFEITDGRLVNEVFLPTDGVSIRVRQEEIWQLMNACREYEIENPDDQFDESYAEDEPIVVEEISWSVDEATDEVDEAGEDKSISREDAFRMFNEILVSVATDLSYNYSVYQDQKDYFINDGNNFKFLYVPEDRPEMAGTQGTRNTGQQYYTNLPVKSRADAVDKIQYFGSAMAAYVVIDATSGNVEEKTVDVSASEFLLNLNQLKYAFQKDGGKIYIGVLAGSVQDFSEYSDDDLYAQMSQVGSYFDTYGMVYVGAILICFLLSIAFLVLITMLCGRRAEDQEVHLIKFDYWYTELGLALGVAVAIGFMAAYLVLTDWLHYGNFYWFIHGKFFFVLSVFFVAALDSAFLFFYCSLVRRIKAERLIRGSILHKITRAFARLFRFMGRTIRSLYQNANVTVKTVLIFVPVLVLLHLHLIAGMYESSVLLIFCWLLDAAFLGLFLYSSLAANRIIQGIEKISSGELEYQVDTRYIYGDNLRLAEAVNHIGNGIRTAINQSMKDERMKADLITNVSHDIKTPLTSIINYVDLLKREQVEDETIRGYIEVLDNKSQRLKQLTDDLVEASKISSGNIVLNMEDLDVVQLMQQALGEFTDKFEEKELSVVTKFPDSPCMIVADSRSIWRVIDNLLGNIYKYALERTRVYIEVKDLSGLGEKASISIKNISKQALNIEAEELTERFIRGDISRSTEGSGLGLSIAKSLVEAQDGTFHLYLDGDLFKVTMRF